MAEDDEDDRILTQEAIVAAGANLRVDFVEDGEDLLAYLRHEGAYAGRRGLPALVLLDLNMPRKSGYEALQDIRQDAALKYLPVIVLSTSSREEDIARSYRSGANAFITKPTSFDDYVAICRQLYGFWFQTVQLPPASAGDETP
jgi:two-component system, response regulator